MNIENKVEFKRIEEGELKSAYPLRDTTVVGYLAKEIAVDMPVCLLAAPRDGGNIRMITTSHVKEYQVVDGVHIVKTETGSEYHITEVSEVVH